MPKLTYDNLDDARSKLQQTFVYYDGQASYVREINSDPDGGNNFSLRVQLLRGKKNIDVRIHDPLLSAGDYNLGYINFIHGAGYYYRVPLRQTRQGLRAEQLGTRFSNANYANYAGFNSNKASLDMLENKYPKAAEAKKLLLDVESEYQIVAFHKDFACTWDRVHKDFILEYKGTLIGHSPDLERFILMDDYKHLNEALKEAVG